MSVSTLAGRPIMLSYRALSSFWGMKSFFFGARCKGLKTRIKSEYQSKGSIYILHLLAFALISIFWRTVLKLKTKEGIRESDEKMRNASLCSKRFQSSYCAKVRAEAKKKRWKGEGRRGNACPQTPLFWKTPLDISRFGSFVNWQLVKIEV